MATHNFFQALLRHDGTSEKICHELALELCSWQSRVNLTIVTGPSGFIEPQETENDNNALEGDVIPVLHSPTRFIHDKTGECSSGNRPGVPSVKIRLFGKEGPPKEN
jgi:hypothetical protein